MTSRVGRPEADPSTGYEAAAQEFMAGLVPAPGFMDEDDNYYYHAIKPPRAITAV